MPAPIINIGGADISFGTVEVAQTFGTVDSATLERTIEELGIPDGFGGFLAYLLMNPGYKFTLVAFFPASGPLPVDGEPLAFADAGVTGNILNWTVNRESKGQRKITINAAYWQSIGSNPTVTTILP